MYNIIISYFTTTIINFTIYYHTSSKRYNPYIIIINTHQVGSTRGLKYLYITTNISIYYFIRLLTYLFITLYKHIYLLPYNKLTTIVRSNLKVSKGHNTSSQNLNSVVYKMKQDETTNIYNTPTHYWYKYLRKQYKLCTPTTAVSYTPTKGSRSVMHEFIRLAMDANSPLSTHFKFLNVYITLTSNGALISNILSIHLSANMSMNSGEGVYLALLSRTSSKRANSRPSYDAPHPKNLSSTNLKNCCFYSAVGVPSI